MSGCCNQGCSVEHLYERQRGTLKIVLVINALMFLVIAAAAIHADSSALLADSLDNLGDALTYALSIYAVTRGAAVKARVALFKGVLILTAALLVAAQIIYRTQQPPKPDVVAFVQPHERGEASRTGRASQRKAAV